MGMFVGSMPTLLFPNLPPRFPPRQILTSQVVHRQTGSKSVNLPLPLAIWVCNAPHIVRSYMLVRTPSYYAPRPLDHPFHSPHLVTRQCNHVTPPIDLHSKGHTTAMPTTKSNVLPQLAGAARTVAPNERPWTDAGTLGNVTVARCRCRRALALFLPANVWQCPLNWAHTD